MKLGRKLLLPVVALSVLMIATSCAPTPIPVVSHNVWCDVDKPLTFDADNDTLETIQQIREHNAAWRAACP